MKAEGLGPGYAIENSLLDLSKDQMLTLVVSQEFYDVYVSQAMTGSRSAIDAAKCIPVQFPNQSATADKRDKTADLCERGEFSPELAVNPRVLDAFLDGAPREWALAFGDDLGAAGPTHE